MRTLLLHLSITATAVFAFVPNAMSWGPAGHEIVGYIADRHLSDSARTQVSKLLALEGRDSLAEVANWADQLRSLAFIDQPSHVVRLPFDNARYAPSSECKANRCVIGGIESSTAALQSPKLSPEAKLAALKFLVHYIGDVHQPLHASQDIGNWKVRFGSRTVTMHEMWDSEIIGAQKSSALKLAEAIDTGPSVPAWGEVAAIDWAFESRDIARGILVGNLAMPMDPPALLPTNYSETNWTVVKERLRRAGYRLAAALNSIFRD